LAVLDPRRYRAGVDPKALRLARRLRQKADAAVLAAAAAEASAGIDIRALRIALTKLGDNPDPAHKAILMAGLTVASAASICKTSPDQIKKAWAGGDHFRPARAEWRRTLAAYGVPRRVWRDRP
jgi:hypothetical protein